MKRRYFLLLAAGIGILSVGGCSWLDVPTMRSQSLDYPELEGPKTQLVGDLAVPTGMHSVKIEAVGLVTGLHGAGSDPGPSPQRAYLLEEMQIRGVTNANAVLASGNVSLVLVQSILRPGIQKGDHFDVEIRVPSRSDTTSLRGGFLLETRLSETAVLGSQIRRGNLLALARGPVMVDPMADPKKDHILMCRGRVLGGGVALKSRTLGLVLTSGHRNVADASTLDKAAVVKSRLHNAVFNSKVANAVNKRFYTLLDGVKTGVAKALDDQYIELQVHPRYKDNITRYMQVVRAVPISESAPERMQRIKGLQNELFDPAVTADAAIQLEAIGSESVDALLEGIQSKNLEVRFYCAEALAFLDRREAAEPLGQIARDQPAFRVYALAALSVMQEFNAYDQLRDLLSSPSTETRYGAFRSLWASNQKNPLVRGEVLGDQFHYHVLDVPGPPMVHVTRNRISEIVLFGPGQRLLTPLAVNAGNEIMVTNAGDDEIAVSKYSVQEGDQKRTVSTRLDDVIRAIVELGGTYPDVVQTLQEAKALGALPSRFEVDALPKAGRSYDRLADGQESPQPEEGKVDDGEPTAKAATARPLPELFATRGETGNAADGKADKKSLDDSDSDEKTNTRKGFFARMLGR